MFSKQKNFSVVRQTKNATNYSAVVATQIVGFK